MHPIIFHVQCFLGQFIKNGEEKRHNLDHENCVYQTVNQKYNHVMWDIIEEKRKQLTNVLLMNVLIEVNYISRNYYLKKPKHILIVKKIQYCIIKSNNPVCYAFSNQQNTQTYWIVFIIISCYN